VWPNRDAARGHEHVGLQAALERGPVGGLVVRDRLEGLDGSSGGGELGLEEDAVRFVDLPRREPLARTA
jgi:hypothetical protein